jgi:hypothetical protein
MIEIPKIRSIPSAPSPKKQLLGADRVFWIHYLLTIH